ncbi:unnamed protein product [Mesocestoides corti]|uniref:Ig-like domain-containing protein n=2 Tax=Mesocestoides corti TaxID=53468 RepID=A0A3P6HWR2_MESCO|nr:unnamed protein product [Mesocestoides corti]
MHIFCRKMGNQLLFLLLATAALVTASVYDDFPQWDPIHWLVPSTETIELSCYHPSYYPFNDLSKGHNIQWILPKPTSYRHLKPGESNEGWKVLNDTKYTLKIDKSIMNVPDAVNGMYVCAVLAPISDKSEIYSWYYLRWGVGLYTNVPAMNEGTIAQKYYMSFTYSWVSTLVAIVIFVLFAITVHFRYKGGPVLEVDEEAGSELSFTSKKSDKKGIDFDSGML